MERDKPKKYDVLQVSALN